MTFNEELQGQISVFMQFLGNKYAVWFYVMKRGSSNCKMILASLNVFCDKYKYIHRTCPMAIELGLSKSGQHSPITLHCSPKVTTIVNHLACNN